MFALRPSGYNSIRTLAARLSCYQAFSGALLAYMPLELKVRGKSTTQSHQTPILKMQTRGQRTVPLSYQSCKGASNLRRQHPDDIKRVVLHGPLVSRAACLFLVAEGCCWGERQGPSQTTW